MAHEIGVLPEHLGISHWFEIERRNHLVETRDAAVIMKWVPLGTHQGRASDESRKRAERIPTANALCPSLLNSSHQSVLPHLGQTRSIRKIHPLVGLSLFSQPG